MHLPWDDSLARVSNLRRYYSKAPELIDVAVRSLHTCHSGFAVSFRLELPSFADRPDPTWAESSFDRIECVVGFVDVSEVEFLGNPVATRATITLARSASPQDTHRIDVQISSGARNLGRFSAHVSTHASSISAYRSDCGKRHYVSPVDRMLHETSHPSLTDSRFYERL